MRVLVTSLFAVALLVLSAGSADARPNVQASLAEVRQATAGYHDVAAARDAGYFQASGCVPGMGYHYLNPAVAGPDTLDALRPSVLLYAPSGNGRLRLVGVEYVAFGATTAPAMFGQTFFGPMTHGIPSHFELHTWIWLGNSGGVFAETNAKVTCP